MKKFFIKLQDSPINYFSDLFIVAMVIVWVVAILEMSVMAIYSTVVNSDNSIWSDLGTLVAVPLSAGGALWMIKNGVQHAIANKKGSNAEMDFPKIDDTGIEKEEEING